MRFLSINPQPIEITVLILILLLNKNLYHLLRYISYSFVVVVVRCTLKAYPVGMP